MRAKLEQYQILIMLIVAAALGGGVGAFSKIGLHSFTPVTFLFFRFIIAASILVPVLLYRERKIKITAPATLLFISLLSVINVTLYIFGVSHTTATISITLYAAVPLFSAVILFALYRERLDRKKELGLLIGFIGVLLIVFLPLIGKPNVSSGTLYGNLMILAAVLSVSFYFIFSKKLQKTYTPIFITTAMVVLTIVIQGLLIPLSGGISLDLAKVSFQGILALLYTGVLGTGVYYVMYQYAIKKASPIIAGLTLYLQPVFGALWAAALLGEKITLGFAAGAVLALVGVYLVTSKGKTVDAKPTP